jgi:hypothetical protein
LASLIATMLALMDGLFCPWWQMTLDDEEECVGRFLPAAYGLPAAAAATSLVLKPLTAKLKIYQL